MPRTLKDQYETRQMQLLRERVRAADKHVMLEHRVATQLIEAMDQGDIDKVTAIIQKLEKIKSPELPKLTAAIEKAEAEVNKYTGGGMLTKAWTKLKSKVGIDNPIVKVTTFANALERGFSQIPQILKNNGVDLKGADLNQSLMTMLGTEQKKVGEKSDEQLSNSIGAKEGVKTKGSLVKEDSVDDFDKNVSIANKKTPQGKKPMKGPSANAAKLKSITSQLIKALAPGGIFAVFKKMFYISGEEVAQELIAAPIKVFANVSKAIQSGPKTDDIATDMKDQIQGSGGEQTKHAGVETPAKPTAQTQPSQPAKPGIAPTPLKATGEHPTQAPEETRGGGTKVQKVSDDVIQNVAKFVAKKTGVDVNTVIKVMNVLNKSEKLREVKQR